MHRFFIGADSFAGDQVTVGGATAGQITRVLRLKPGDRVVFLDNSGWEYETEIERIQRDTVAGRIVRKSLGAAEPAIHITLCQALIKADKIEFVIQKCTELGVKTFQPFGCARCVATMPSDEKMTRWQAIIREAAEQCGRSILPVLQPPVHFEDLCRPSVVASMILWERERTHGLSKLLANAPFLGATVLRVIVGPEGGFTEKEIGHARNAGIVPIGLGKRVLRTETAGLAAVSAIMFERGELG